MIIQCCVKTYNERNNRDEQQDGGGDDGQKKISDLKL